jgi:hypothetical protein
MYSALKSLTFCTCFGLVSLMAVAQGTTCSGDGDSAQGSPIACVTGQGVEVKAAPAPAASQSSDVLPLAPEQRPAMQPTVIFADGKLTIIANNSMLSDILRIVGQKTGATIDVPGEANERVVSQLGPGQPREVIASLLNGSHFNYVMVGNETDANAVSRIVLTAKSDKGSTGTPSPNGGPTVAGNISRPAIQARTALQQAVMQPYQEMLQQQQAQQLQTPDFQQQPVASTSEAPAPVTQASANGEAGVQATPAVQAGPTGTETAAIDQPTSGEAATQKPQGERTPQQMLQDLYETRRQMMAQQQKTTQQSQTPQQ